MRKNKCVALAVLRLILGMVLHGQYEVGGLLVYSAAVYVVLAFRDSRRLRIDENVSHG
jgi:hypothetical protein